LLITMDLMLVKEFLKVNTILPNSLLFQRIWEELLSITNFLRTKGLLRLKITMLLASLTIIAFRLIC
jgi:hypothetical protein